MRSLSGVREAVFTDEPALLRRQQHAVARVLESIARRWHSSYNRRPTPTDDAYEFLAQEIVGTRL
jgi:hypothetical protein